MIESRLWVRMLLVSREANEKEANPLIMNCHVVDPSPPPPGYPGSGVSVATNERQDPTHTHLTPPRCLTC